MIRSKTAEAERATKDANDSEKKRADLEKKLADTEVKITRTQGEVREGTRYCTREGTRRSAPGKRAIVGEVRPEATRRGSLGAEPCGRGVRLCGAQAINDVFLLTRKRGQGRHRTPAERWFRVPRSLGLVRRVEDQSRTEHPPRDRSRNRRMPSLRRRHRLPALLRQRVDPGRARWSLRGRRWIQVGTWSCPFGTTCPRTRCTRHSPMLAGLLALNTAVSTVDEIADSLVDVVRG